MACDETGFRVLRLGWGLVLCLVLAGGPVHAEPAPLVEAARAQIGVTVSYDPAYVRLGFPGGDVPQDRGVCTDVIVRAYRVAYGFDLQEAVNTDMRPNFSAYPKTWGLDRPDRNIDHRRVPNLQVFFARQGERLSVTTDPMDYQPGDLVTQMLPGNLPHIGIISDRRSASGRPLVIHNIGQGTREEDTLLSFPVTGHYRFAPAHNDSTFRR
jgi:uncharacterized protein YijF (DUF1287 family)